MGNQLIMSGWKSMLEGRLHVHKRPKRTRIA